MSVTVSIEYLTNLNWSLLELEVPFLTRFAVVAEGGASHETDEVSISLSLRGPTEVFLEPVEIVTSFGSDVAAKFESAARSQWRKQVAWNMSGEVEQGTLLICFKNPQCTARLPVNIINPACWHRVLGNVTDLKVSKAQFTAMSGEITPSIQRDTFPWSSDAVPPLEIGIVKLIDPEDSRNARNPREMSLELEVERWLLELPKEEKNDDPLKLELRALYEIIRSQRISTRQLIQEFPLESDHVRLLDCDMENGARPKSLVLLACELLETKGRRPVFILAGEGKRAVLGVWKPTERNKPKTIIYRDSEALQPFLDALEILDVNDALNGTPYGQAAAKPKGSVLDGFVHAVDVWAARVSHYPAKTPLRRPRSISGWIPAYLQQQLEVQKKEEPEHKLDDPLNLFVSLQRGELLAHHQRQDDIPAGLLYGEEGEGWVKSVVLDKLGRAAILADGGSGKTYVCRSLFSRLARQWLDSPAGNHPAPILFRCCRLAQGANLLNALADSVGLPEGGEGLVRASSAQSLLIILDGFDESGFAREAGTTTDYSKLLEPLDELTQTSILLTARRALFAGDPQIFLPRFSLSTICGWGDEDFMKYLQRCETKAGITFIGGHAAFYQRIRGADAHEALGALSKTPLYARMLVETRKQIEGGAAGREIQNELDLYDHYTTASFERKKAILGKPDEPSGGHGSLPMTIKLAQEATSEIAVQMYVKQQPLTRKEILNDLASFHQGLGIQGYRAFVNRDVMMLGLLVPEAKDYFRFSHVSFEHYYLARHLVDALPVPNRATASLILGCATIPEGALSFVAQCLQRNPAVIAGLLNLAQTKRDDRHTCFYNDPRRVEESPQDPVNIAWRNLILILLACRQPLKGLDLSDLDFSNANLSGACLDRCDLTGSVLRGAELSRASLVECTLVRANLSHAEMTGTNLSQSKLSQCQLAQIRVSDPQLLPNICGAQDLGGIEINGLTVETIDLLIECVKRCEDSEWAARARQELRNLLG